MEREGGDITAADMIAPLTEPSKIQNYFTGRVIFVTGGTGFLGRLLVEKLLRTCASVERIYILLRSKNGKSWERRFEKYFDGPLYERIKREKPEVLAKLRGINGDCSEPELGLSEHDKNLILSEVNCVFHFATCLSFEDKLRHATYVNVRSTRDLLQMARNFWELTSIVCLSTTSAYFPKQTIHENFYKPPIEYKKLLSLVESLRGDKLDLITPTILDKWPNPSTFTMAVSEDVIKKNSNGLPIAVVRPSIVIGTSKEPVSGWIDSNYGTSGFFTGVSLGLIHTFQCELGNTADLVPADFVVNASIAAAWDVANTKKFSENSEDFEEIQQKYDSEVPIYNYVSGPQKPISWEECLNLNHHHIQNIPSKLEVWHHFLLPSSNRLIYKLLHYLLHIFPAIILCCLATLFGKDYKFLATYIKIGKSLDWFSYYTCREWTYGNERAQELWKKLNEEDKKNFEFNIGGLDWDLYFHTFARGSRVYLLKDSLETISEGESKRFKLKMIHYSLVFVLSAGVLKVFFGICAALEFL